MKKVYLLFAFLLVCVTGFSQDELSKEEKERREKNIEAGNPFARFGYKAKVATLSKGKYLEFHDLDSIVTIGSVRFNVYKNQIVGNIVQDTLNPDAQPIGDVTGRWISPDPLSEEFPEWSPYTMVMNSPIRFNDPTGMAPEWTPDKNGNLIAEKGDNTKTLAKYLGTTTKDISNRFTLKANGKSLPENHEFKTGERVNLNNRMNRSVQNSEDKDGSFNCFGSVRTYVSSNNELNGENSSNAGDLFDNYFGGTDAKNIDNKVKESLTQIDSFDDAVFGKTVIEFDGHVALYYGTDNSGTHYFYSKNGTDKPEITTLQNMQSMTDKPNDYKLYNIEK